MSQSTDAILFFGILIEEETPVPASWDRDTNDDSSWLGYLDEWLRRTQPDFTAVPRVDQKINPDGCRKWEEYLQAKRELEKNCRIEIDYHFSSDYPMYFVCTQKFVANRGYPHTFASLPEGTLDDVVELHQFCKIMDIPFSEPAWHMVSYWG